MNVRRKDGRVPAALPSPLPQPPPPVGLVTSQGPGGPRSSVLESLPYLRVHDCPFLPLLLNDVLEASLIVVHHQAEEQRGDLPGHEAQVPQFCPLEGQAGALLPWATTHSGYGSTAHWGVGVGTSPP